MREPSANFLGRAKSRLLEQWVAERDKDPDTWQVGARGWNARLVVYSADRFKVHVTVMTYDETKARTNPR